MSGVLIELLAEKELPSITDSKRIGDRTDKRTSFFQRFPNAVKKRIQEKNMFQNFTGNDHIEGFKLKRPLIVQVETMRFDL